MSSGSAASPDSESTSPYAPAATPASDAGTLPRRSTITPMSFAGARRLGGMTIERDLHKAFRGPVYLPGDQAYDAARATWSGALDQRPAVIAEAMSAADVQTAVAVARTHGLPFAV